MPPQKKAEGRETPDLLVANCREAAIKKLKKQASLLEEDDFHRLVESVCALIDLNNEIWIRCLSNRIGTGTGCLSNRIAFGEFQSDPGAQRYYRVGYFKVRVSTEHYASGNKLSFKALPELSTKEFPGFPPIPPILAEVFPFGNKETIENEDYLKEYEQYLKKALLLQEEVSKPFLSILKEHLKEIQVSLGEIESWLIEAGYGLGFINEQFQLELRPPQLGDGCGPDCKERHGMASICLKCFQPRSMHESGGFGSTPSPFATAFGSAPAPAPSFGSQRDSFGSAPAPAPFGSQRESFGRTGFGGAPFGSSRESGGDGHGFCPNKRGATLQRGSFLTSHEQEIKQAHLPWGDEVTMSFNICSESEQERLKKFIHFVEPEANVVAN